MIGIKKDLQMNAKFVFYLVGFSQTDGLGVKRKTI